MVVIFKFIQDGGRDLGAQMCFHKISLRTTSFFNISKTEKDGFVDSVAILPFLGSGNPVGLAPKSLVATIFDFKMAPTKSLLQYLENQKW